MILDAPDYCPAGGVPRVKLDPFEWFDLWLRNEVASARAGIASWEPTPCPEGWGR